MGLTPYPESKFGGVDSRDNPLVMPRDRFLRLRNWVPKTDLHLELRDGYTKVTTNPELSTLNSLSPQVHSIFPWTNPDTGENVLLFWQGTQPRVLHLGNMSVTVPTVKGAAISGVVRWSYALGSNGHAFAANGVNVKFYDGTYWRDCGLRSLDATEVQNVSVLAGIRPLTDDERAAVTITVNNAGNFPRNIGQDAGYYFYVAIFDTAVDELGPSQDPVGSGNGGPNGRYLAALSPSGFSFANLPNISGAMPTTVKLIARTEAGGSAANFCAKRAPMIVQSATRSGSVATITMPQFQSHGLVVGDVVAISGFVKGPDWTGIYTVRTVPSAGVFTVTLASGTLDAGGSGYVTPLVTVLGGTTVVDINSTAEADVTANVARGLPAYVADTGQPGYQFYASIWNKVTGHVGNAIAIGTRLKNAYAGNVRISGLPNISANDSEWGFLLGRTGDGALEGYVMTDSDGNWVTVEPGQTTALITTPSIDAGILMPTRNGLPQPFDKLWHANDALYGAKSGKATVWRSGSESNTQGAEFVGDPSQAWAPNDIETFPTAQGVTAGHAYFEESWVFALGDLAVLGDPTTLPGWQGPWNYGSVGQWAWTRGWKNLPFWVSTEKQLCTMLSAQEGPVSISSEYEQALLARIGDSYLKDTEVVYFRDVHRQIDELRIRCQDASGAFFHIVHDFNLRDDASPYGQAYEEAFGDALAGAHTLCYVRQDNGRPRLWAGGVNALYQLHDGANDNGSEFTADAIQLLYAGPLNTATKIVEWYGDGNIQWYQARTLDTPLDRDKFQNLSDKVPRPVPGQEGNSHWMADLYWPEFTHCYLWVQLDSHSADGDMELNDPPHVPLETYGRLWFLVPLIGTSRGK